MGGNQEYVHTLFRLAGNHCLLTRARPTFAHILAPFPPSVASRKLCGALRAGILDTCEPGNHCRIAYVSGAGALMTRHMTR